MALSEEDKAKNLAYHRLFSEVSAALFGADPIGINFGHNTDEYDPEARTILPRLMKAASPDEAIIIVKEEFHTWFGNMSDDIDYSSVAARLWEIRRKYIED